MEENKNQTDIEANIVTEESKVEKEEDQEKVKTIEEINLEMKQKLEFEKELFQPPENETKFTEVKLD